MNKVRFLSFNIHGGRNRGGSRDLNRIRDLMDTFSVDIGVFQEMETRANRGGTPYDVDVLAGPDRPHRCVGASMYEGEGWYGNLIVSKYPLVYGIVHNLETKPVFEPRNAVDALIASPLGNIRVVGTHLSLSPLERWSEAHKLIELMAAVEAQEKNPILLMGDMNEWQWPSRLLSYLNKVMTPVSCKATFPAWYPLFRLDRLWHDAGELKISARRLNDGAINTLSDHLPLLIEASV